MRQKAKVSDFAMTEQDASKRNWFAIGVTIAICLVLALDLIGLSLDVAQWDEMYEFIEVQKHHLCWSYSSFALYALVNVATTATLVTICTISLILVKRKRPRAALTFFLFCLIAITALNSLNTCIAS